MLHIQLTTTKRRTSETVNAVGIIEVLVTYTGQKMIMLIAPSPEPEILSALIIVIQNVGNYGSPQLPVQRALYYLSPLLKCLYLLVFDVSNFKFISLTASIANDQIFYLMINGWSYVHGFLC